MRLTLAAVLIVASTLAACSLFDSSTSKVNYKTASGPALPPLEVPPNLTRPGQDDRYAVPDVARAGGSATLSAYNSDRVSGPKAGSTEVLPEDGQMKVVREGSERWLVVPQPVEKLWPQVREFWQDSGFLLTVDSPQTGVMETDWAENRATIGDDGLHSLFGKLLGSVYSTGERDKFRTRMERGANPGVTEIYVSHRGMVESLVNTNGSQEGATMWQPRPPDPGLEAEFLRRIMLRLGASEGSAKAALADPSVIERARMTSDAGGNGVLEVNEPFDRAWRRVGLALDRVGFTVEDRDRAKGQYFVRYIDPSTDESQQKKGFLNWIGLGGSDKPKVADPKDQYRIQVRGEGDALTAVTVINQDGKPDNSTVGRRILALLQDQLK